MSVQNERRDGRGSSAGLVAGVVAGVAAGRPTGSRLSGVLAACAVGLGCGAAAGQADGLAVSIYADIGGGEIGPGEQAGVVVGQTVRYRVVAEIGDGFAFPYLASVSIDLAPFDCGADAFVTDFEYGDWATTTTPPVIAGDAILGIEAFQFGGDVSNPVEVCSFEIVAEFGLITYVAQGTGPGGEAFSVGLFDSFGAEVVDGPRVIAVGGPGKGGPCTGADLAEPFGVLDLRDIQSFVTRFGDGGCRADLAAPWGVLDLGDLSAFVDSFVGGCL